MAKKLQSIFKEAVQFSEALDCDEDVAGAVAYSRCKTNDNHRLILRTGSLQSHRDLSQFHRGYIHSAA